MYLDCFLGEIDAVDRLATAALNFNGGYFGDLFFSVLSSNVAWIPILSVYVCAMVFALRNTVWLLVAMFLGLAFAVFLCDSISADIIKPFFMRLRPSHDIRICGLLHYVGSYRGGMYGFVSSHASNAFGAVAYATVFFRNKAFRISAYAFSCLVAYSRIYLGVHYLGDILGGMVLGLLIGSVMGWGVKSLFARSHPFYLVFGS